jgi:hypothetical protein
MNSWDWAPFLAAADELPEAVHRRWYQAGIADGLPIVPPTPERVRRLYREAGMDPVHQLAVVEPAMYAASAYDVAVCATAAGCAPDHLGIVAAALQAVCRPRFNLLGVQTTTGTATPLIIVHGPAAPRAGVSGGPDCLGGSTHANATIGRALRLLLRALGGAGPATMDRATTGQPAKLGLCFAENVEASPWPPLHTTLGFAAAESAVTVVGVSGSVEVVHAEDGEPEEILTTLAGSMAPAGNAGSRGLLGGGSPLVVLSPEHAQALDRAGYDRGQVCQALWELAVLPWQRLAPSVASRLRRAPEAAEDASAAGLRVAEQPEDILVAVAGGIGVKSTYLPSWGGGTRAVTMRIEFD